MSIGASREEKRREIVCCDVVVGLAADCAPAVNDAVADSSTKK
jgi:hypothetical protein